MLYQFDCLSGFVQLVHGHCDVLDRRAVNYCVQLAVDNLLSALSLTAKSDVVVLLKSEVVFIELNAELFFVLWIRPSEGARLLSVTNIDFGQLLVIDLLEDYSIILTAIFNLHRGEALILLFYDHKHLVEILLTVYAEEPKFRAANGLKYFRLDLWGGEKHRPFRFFLLLVLTKEVLFLDLART